MAKNGKPVEDRVKVLETTVEKLVDLLRDHGIHIPAEGAEEKEPADGWPE